MKLSNIILQDSEPVKQNVIRSDENGYKIENYVDAKQSISLFFGIDNYFDLNSKDFAKYDKYKLEMSNK